MDSFLVKPPNVVWSFTSSGRKTLRSQTTGSFASRHRRSLLINSRFSYYTKVFIVCIKIILIEKSPGAKTVASSIIWSWNLLRVKPPLYLLSYWRTGCKSQTFQSCPSFSSLAIKVERKLVHCQSQITILNTVFRREPYTVRSDNFVWIRVITLR